jgi:7,8-dihydropterin-6-yl-methyl-4-(beta-D-ribofuranosyl)aminobenzene 5'-phosphate synthase
MERLHAFAVVLVAGVLTVPAALAEPGESVSPIEPAQEVSITTVFDNYTVDARLETRWGFAAVVAAPSTIEPGIRTTGPLRTSIQEQALVVSTAQGLVVMTGCAHPGIVRIVQKAREMSPKENIALVMGGFHLASASSGEIDEIVRAFRNLDVQRVAPSHCTGDFARERFERAYGPDYVAGGAGMVLRFSIPRAPAP